MNRRKCESAKNKGGEKHTFCKIPKSDLDRNAIVDVTNGKTYSDINKLMKSIRDYPEAEKQKIIDFAQDSFREAGKVDGEFDVGGSIGKLGGRFRKRKASEL